MRWQLPAFSHGEKVFVRATGQEARVDGVLLVSYGQENEYVVTVPDDSIPLLLKEGDLAAAV